MSVYENVTPVAPLLSFTVTLIVSNGISEFTFHIALTHKCTPPLSLKMKQKQKLPPPWAVTITTVSEIKVKKFDISSVTNLLDCSCLLNFGLNATGTTYSNGIHSYWPRSTHTHYYTTNLCDKIFQHLTKMPQLHGDSPLSKKLI